MSATGDSEAVITDNIARTFFVTRHAYSCSNLKNDKGSGQDRLTEREPSLTLWGILQTLIRSDEYPINPNAPNPGTPSTESIVQPSRSSTPQRVYVSCLIRTWMTAILLYAPNYKEIELRVAPYVKEEQDTAGNLPINFNEQLKKIGLFFGFLKKINSFMGNNEGLQILQESLALPQLQKMTSGTVHITFSDGETTNKVTFKYDLAETEMIAEQNLKELNATALTAKEVYGNKPSKATPFALVGKVGSFFTSFTDTRSTYCQFSDQQRNFRDKIHNKYSLPIHNEECTKEAIFYKKMFEDDILNMLNVIEGSGENEHYVQGIPLIPLIANDKSNTVNYTSSEINDKNETPTPSELTTVKLSKFIAWIIKNFNHPGPYHCVFHSNLMSNFLANYFSPKLGAKDEGSPGKTFKKSYECDKQNSWTFEMHTNGNSILDCTIYTGRSQPKKNKDYLISSCQFLCDYGYETEEAKKGRKNKCAERLYTMYDSPTPIENERESSLGGKRSKSKKRAQQQKQRVSVKKQHCSQQTARKNKKQQKYSQRQRKH